MKTRSLLFGALATALTMPALAATSSIQEPTELVFAVRAIDTARGGAILCALYDHEEDWLGAHPFRYDKGEIVSEEVICVFERVPEGTYAVSVTHDEDGDGEMDRNLIGLPVEGLCASRDAQLLGFGAPDWYDAAFHYDGLSGYMTGTMSY